ncbi:MAG: tetratricopeptide repeat protein [Flavobacteriales bacterium]|nr:tetratricopeptide repeat protein [Flavobacteriales bacterium]
MGGLEESINYFNKELELLISTGDEEAIPITSNNVGYSYLQLGKYNLAEKTLLKGLEFCTANSVDDDGTLHESLSELYAKTRELDKSLIHAATTSNDARRLKMDQLIVYRENIILQNLGVKKQQTEVKKNVAETEVIKPKKGKTCENSINYFFYLAIILDIANLFLLFTLIKKSKA